jgi:hypothetical protein
MCRKSSSDGVAIGCRKKLTRVVSAIRTPASRTAADFGARSSPCTMHWQSRCASAASLRVKNERNAVRANGVAAARCGRRVDGKSVPTSKRAADSAKRARRTTNRVAARRRLDNLRTSTWIVRRNLLPRRPHGQDAVPIPASRATPASERTARNATPSPGHSSSPTPVSMPAGALSALRRVSAAVSLNSSIRPCHFSRLREKSARSAG